MKAIQLKRIAIVGRIYRIYLGNGYLYDFAYLRLANRNPFFLSKLNSKLEQLVPNAMVNSKINNDSIF